MNAPAAPLSLALLGHPNSGKTALFNLLTGADVIARDQLFATLDPTVRRMEDLSGGEILLADTVGFVSDLPHELIAAFRATLQEAREADLLLHVIDASDPYHSERQAQVEQVLDSIGASLRLTEGAETLFAELKRLGYKTAILSGGFTYFAKQLQAKLGIDYVFANELQIVDGALTGVAVEPIVDAQRKADLLRELAHKEGLRLEQTIAVGDGANDLPMLGLAGLGVAFRAKPLVKQSAKQAISTLGLDGILYLLGFRDRDGHD